MIFIPDVYIDLDQSYRIAGSITLLCLQAAGSTTQNSGLDSWSGSFVRSAATRFRDRHRLGVHRNMPELGLSGGWYSQTVDPEGELPIQTLGL